MATKFKKPYDPPQRVQKDTSALPSVTRQSFKQECDINHIMKKYQKTGLVDHVTRFQGNYDDLTGSPDYHEAMNKIITANDAFSTLPSSVRTRFHNNPAEFLDFVSNPDNMPEMEAMGLIPPSPTEPVPVEDAPPPEPVE